MNKIDRNPVAPLRILDTRLHADPSRVVLRPFHLGWQAARAEGSRALKLVENVAELSETQVRREYRKVLADFKERHWQTETMFEERWQEVEASLGLQLAQPPEEVLGNAARTSDADPSTVDQREPMSVPEHGIP